MILCIPTLVVKSVTAQREARNLQGKSVRLDVLAEGEDGSLYDVEVQRASQGAKPKRARYYSSLMDANAINAGEVFADGAHIVYANGAYEGNDPIGRLMHDFRESDPSNMHYPKLANRAKYLKESEEEVKEMGGPIEELINEVTEEVTSRERLNTVHIMLDRYTEEEILAHGYTVEEIEKAKQLS